MMTLSVFFKRTNDKKEKSHVSPLEYTRGAFCSVVNIMVTYPINKVAFRQQSHNLSIIGAIKAIKAEVNRYRGVGPPLAQKCIDLSLMYGLYETYYSIFNRRYDLRQKWYLSGLIGVLVGCSESLLVPFERTQTLLSVPEFHSKYARVIDLMKILFKSGIKELYCGFWINNFITGSMIGCFNCILTFPLNVVKTHMQKALKGGVTFRRTFYIVYIYRFGIRGVYRGITVTILRSILSWGIINSIYEFTKKLF